ncbi:MAG: 4Fe-4S dicluster domain-containing protein, partial [Synergistaceae bacterium]|nr:4Fe-4S dicluster domain-containing protein [Synergistaceae bacterium]
MRQRPVEYFSMRLGITGGHVTAEQLAAITEVSKKYGRGYIHLTSRQGIEIPYIEYDDIEAVKSALAEGGVMLGASGPRVRTITACQGNAICLNGCIETQGLAEELRDRYYGRDLPHKFKIGITGCPNNCLKAEENDIGIKGGIKPEWKPENCVHCGKCEKVCKRGAISISDGAVTINASECVNCGKCVRSCPSGSIEGTEGYVVSFGGTFGNRIVQGEVIIPFIEDKARLIAVCDAAMKFFEDNGKAGERLRYTIERVGADEFRRVILEAE